MGLPFGNPLLFQGALAAFGKGGTICDIHPSIMGLMDWFFDYISEFIPAWQLDGGHMARTLLGAKWHKYATYGSLGILGFTRILDVCITNSCSVELKKS